MNSKIDKTENDERAIELTFSSPAFDAKEYAKVAQKARLEDIRLSECNYSVRHECFAEAEFSNKPLSQGYFGEMTGHKFDPKSGRLIGGYRWGAEVRFGRRKALKIKCEYVLIYSGFEEANSDYARLYFQKLARFTSYPYFRSHFAVQTSASGLNLGPLPSLVDRVD